MVLWFIVFLSPAIVHAGTIYYVDETPCDERIEEQQESPPRPLFPHPQLEPEYQVQQDYYFREQNYTEKVIYKKDSSYFDINYAWIDLSISSGRSITPKYETQNYTDTQTTTSQSGGSTVTSTSDIFVTESFVINDYGSGTLIFPVHEDSAANRQPGYQINAVTRNGHFAYGVELSYQNIAAVILKDAQYTITQTRTSTTTNTSVDATSGATSTTSPGTTTTNYTAEFHIEEMSIKMVDMPINFTLMYFPIYDGYIQPYVKAGLGMNMSYTTLEYQLPVGYTGPGTFAPFYIEGWGVSPFTFTYGAGVHVMLTDSWAVHFSYLSQSLNSQTRKFTTIAIDQDNEESNQAYGAMRFKISKKATLVEMGLAYYF